MSDTPEADKQWAEFLNKLEKPIDVFVDFARKLERERNEAREDAKRATYDAAQETIKVSTVKSHWIEACRERNNLQDQRDFAMREIERLRTEYFEMLDSAWGLIANAGGGNCNWDLQTEQWRQAARRWRDKYLSTPASKEEKEAAK